MYVHFSAVPNRSYKVCGPRNDLKFVEELGKIKVSKMDIGGYFAAEWPRYLERMLGMPVWNPRNKSAGYLEELSEFQKRTENFIA